MEARRTGDGAFPVSVLNTLSLSQTPAPLFRNVVVEISVDVQASSSNWFTSRRRIIVCRTVLFLRQYVHIFEQRTEPWMGRRQPNVQGCM